MISASGVPYTLGSVGRRTRLPENTGQADQNVVDSIEVWSSSSESDRVRELSHWLGYGMWRDEDRWRGIGTRVRARFGELSRFLNTPAKADRVLEWGSGGGAIAVEMGKGTSAYYGVDVSAENLAECARRCGAEGVGSFSPILIGDTPEKALEGIEGTIDLFVSIAVFQHFPGKDYGRRVLDVVAKLLKPGGMGIVQFRYDDGTERFLPKTGNYREHFVYFTSYQLVEFWEALKAAGLRPLYLGNFDPKTNYASVYFVK